MRQSYFYRIQKVFIVMHQLVILAENPIFETHVYQTKHKEFCLSKYKYYKV